MKRNDDWLVENELETDQVFDEVWVATSDTRLSQERASEIFESHSVYVTVAGELRVDGHLAVEEASYLECGDVHCVSFWMGEGVVDVQTIHAELYVELACWPSDMYESHINKIVTPLLLTPSEDLDGLCNEIEAEFVMNKVEESGKLFPWILLDNPGEIVAALRDGVNIDEAWLIAHKHLVTDETRKKYVEEKYGTY